MAKHSGHPRRRNEARAPEGKPSPPRQAAAVLPGDHGAQIPARCRETHDDLPPPSSCEIGPHRDFQIPFRALAHDNGLWPDADPADPHAGGRHHPGRQRHRACSCPATPETRDEDIGRAVADYLRPVELQQPARFEDGHPISQRHRLGLVMGDIDERLSKPLVQRLQFCPHLGPQLRVEVRKRLVHQKDRCLARDPPAPPPHAGAARPKTARACGPDSPQGAGSRPSAAHMSRAPASASCAVRA